MSEKFSHAGVSRLKGEFKVRFANDGMRVKVLAKNGHSDIDIIELKEPMTKEDAVNYLLEIRFYEQNGVENAEVKAALEAAQEKRAPQAANKEQKGNKEKRKPKKEKAPKVSLETIRAKKEDEVPAENLEDAPF